jgi:hypothetical protein
MIDKIKRHVQIGHWHLWEVAFDDGREAIIEMLRPADGVNEVQIGMSYESVAWAIITDGVLIPNLKSA